MTPAKDAKEGRAAGRGSPGRTSVRRSATAPRTGSPGDTVDRQGPRQDGENPPLKALHRLMQTQISSPRWSATRMRTRNSAMTAPISTPHTSSCDWRARPLLLELQADAELTRKASGYAGPANDAASQGPGAATRQRARRRRATERSPLGKGGP